MTVLHVNEHLAHKGGVETYLFGRWPRLRERGVEPVVAYGDGDASLHAPSHHAPALGTAGLWAEARARTQMETVLHAVAPDVIHIHNVQNVGALQASLAHGPTVLTTHDYRWVCPANNFFHARPQAVCERTCGPGCFATTLTKHCVTPRPRYAPGVYRRARWGIEHAADFARVLAPSRGARTKYEESGFQEANLDVLPYFCAPAPAASPRPLPEPPTITYLGRIAANKGHEYFVEALGTLPDDVQGRMVGSITEEAAARLRDLAARHNCADRLSLHGWASQAEILKVLEGTSVLVFPSLWPETLGLVGLEALSQGVPVVASEVGGVREWCHDGETGYGVPPADGAAIAERVAHLLGDEDRLRAFGARGIELVKERFRPTQHVDRLLRIYRQVQPAVQPASSHA